MVECSQLISSGQALWFPVEDTPAAAVGGGASLADDARQLATSLLHLLRVLLVHLKAGLHDHHVAPIFLAAVADVSHAVGDDLVVLFGCASLGGPVGIERHAYHIPPATVLPDDVEVPVIEALLVAPVQMHEDGSLREHLLHGIVAGTYEARILLWVLFDMPHGPQQSVGRLVAHLHPARLDVVLLQQREDVDGVLAHILQHLLIRVSLPGCGDGLFGGVGPRVGIVEVHHQIHAQRLHAARHGQQRILVTVSSAGINPDAHADGGHLVVVLQELQALAFLSAAIVELHSSAFLPREKSHVGSLHKIHCSTLCARQQRQRQQQ